MNNSISVNYSILQAIPINRKVKSSLVRYYFKLISNNGGQYAVDKIKGLRQAIMAYIADPQRISKRDEYIQKTPFKNKGLLSKLLCYADTLPHAVLNLLKLYIQPSGSPLEPRDEASAAQQEALARISDRVYPEQGSDLLELLAYLLQDLTPLWKKGAKRMKRPSKEDKEASAQWRKLLMDAYVSRLLERYNILISRFNPKYKGSFKEFVSWYFTFRRILRPLLKPESMQAGRTMLENAWACTPRPSLYKDFKPFKGSKCKGTSVTFQKDLFCTLMYNHILTANTAWYDPNSVTKDTVQTNYFYWNLFTEYVMDVLDKEGSDYKTFGDWMRLTSDEDYFSMHERFIKEYLRTTAYPYKWYAQSFLSEDLLRMSEGEIMAIWPEYDKKTKRLSDSFLDIYNRGFGELQMIPKKGTTDWRPIAAPNRFIQSGLVCLNDYLQTILRKLPRDATFDQKKFDKSIKKLLNDPTKYVGSVDLSKATDNLPFDWFKTIMTSFSKSPLPDEIAVSWQMFKSAVRGHWKNNNQWTTWTVGQPLGTLPSFGVLGVTHNLILEAISVLFGYFNSPYFVLGDDVVITSPEVRDFYIRLMEGCGVPLSLHKSYDHRLTEFAGKIFIRGQPVLHCSDHLKIRLINLFDYQRSTGTIIPWRFVPPKVRRSVSQFVELFRFSDDIRGKLSYAHERVAEVLSDGFKLDFSCNPSPSKVYSFISSCIHHDARGWGSSGEDPEYSERRFIFSYLTFYGTQDEGPVLTTQLDEEFLYVQDPEQEAINSSPSFLSRQQADRNIDQCPGDSGVPKHNRSRRGAIRSNLIDPNKDPEDRGGRPYHFKRLSLLNKRFSGFRQQINHEDTFERNQRWFKTKYRPVTTEIYLIMAYVALQVQKEA